MRKLRVAVIGLGRMGLIHCQTLKHIDSAELVACADIDSALVSKYAYHWQVPKATSDPLEVLADRRVDAVVICTPTSTHAELIREAAKHGKHIFCEKPIAVTLEEADSVLQIVTQSGVKFMVGFNRRFDPHFNRTKQLLEEGKIGTPWILKITSYDPAPPPISFVKTSGGIFLDMTIHDFDMARFLFGDVEEVYATGGVLVDFEIEKAGDVDTVIVTLRFKSGALGVITNCRKAAYGYDQRIEILGEKGGLFVENPLPYTTRLANENGYCTPPLYHFFPERYREAYIAEMKAFVEAVREGKEPPVTGLDGKIAMVMGYAAKKSLLERRAVRLKEIDPSLV